MNCLIGIVVAVIALIEARNIVPRVQVYEIRHDTRDDGISSLEDQAQPHSSYSYNGQSGLKKRLSNSRGKLSAYNTENTISLLNDLLQTLEKQQSNYKFVDKTRSDYDDQPKRSLDLADLVLRAGDHRKTPRLDMRTGAPIHRYVYNGPGGNLRAQETSSDSSD